MPITAAYELGLALTHLRATIDASQLWRALCASPDLSWEDLKTLADAETSSSAVASIIRGPVLGDPTLPKCFIRHLANGDFSLVSTTGVDVQGIMLMQFESLVPSVYAPSANNDLDTDGAYMWWVESIARIISEMKEAVTESPAGLLLFDRIHRNSIGLCDPNECSDGKWRCGAEFEVIYQGEV